MNSKTKWLIIAILAVCIGGTIVYAQANGLLTLPASANVKTSAALVSSPGTLTFGDITQGESVQKQVTVTNTGSVATGTLSLQITGLPTGLTLTSDLPTTINAGQAVSVTFTLDASATATEGVTNFEVTIQEATT